MDMSQSLRCIIVWKMELIFFFKWIHWYWLMVRSWSNSIYRARSQMRRFRLRDDMNVSIFIEGAFVNIWRCFSTEIEHRRKPSVHKSLKYLKTIGHVQKSSVYKMCIFREIQKFPKVINCFTQNQWYAFFNPLKPWFRVLSDRSQTMTYQSCSFAPQLHVTFCGIMSLWGGPSHCRILICIDAGCWWFMCRNLILARKQVDGVCNFRMHCQLELWHF